MGQVEEYPGSAQLLNSSPKPSLPEEDLAPAWPKKGNPRVSSSVAQLVWLFLCL